MPPSFSVAKIHNTIGCVAQEVSLPGWSGHLVPLTQWGDERADADRDFQQPDLRAGLPAVHDVIQKIRWEHAHKSVAVCYNNYYLLSVPIDSDEPGYRAVLPLHDGRVDDLQGLGCLRISGATFRGEDADYHGLSQWRGPSMA